MGREVNGVANDRISTVVPVPEASERFGKVHMIGIGGSGMSGAASLLLQLGSELTGSDEIAFDGLGALVRRGIRVSIGHREAQLPPDADWVVISAAIPESNPELAAARQAGIPVIKYAELLGKLMERRQGVAIAGTHGKSTTTAMTSFLMRQGGLKPSYIIGAKCPDLGGDSSGVGTGPHFVVESCEFGRSFLHLKPQSAAVLNVEPDHLDYYGGIEAILDAFSRFCSNVASEGLVLVNGEDPLAGQAARASHARVETFGRSNHVDWQAVNVRQERGCFAFDLLYKHLPILSTELSIPGLHNLYNALAAIGLAFHAGANPDSIAQFLRKFSGVQRRMTWRGQGRGITIIDDYAHHPTEIRATLEAIRNHYRPKRLWVIFQPHQISRTRFFMDEFADALLPADQVIITDVFSVRECKEDAGRCARELASRIEMKEANGCGRYTASPTDVLHLLAKEAQEGDLMLTMGAGDIGKLADELVERFCNANGAGDTTRTADLVSPRRAGSVSLPSF